MAASDTQVEVAGGHVPTCQRCDEPVAQLRLDRRHGSIVGTYYELVCSPCGHTDGVAFDFTKPAASSPSPVEDPAGIEANQGDE